MKKYLTNELESNIPSQNDLQSAFSVFKEKGQEFQHMSSSEIIKLSLKRRNVFTSQTICLPASHPPKCLCSENFSSGQLITVVSGNIIDHQSLTCSEETCNFCFYDITFHLHKSLALNLTFKHIYFSTELQFCYRRNLTLFHTGKWRMKNDFSFCGFQSFFNLYPSFQKVSIQVFIELHALYSYEAFFSVLDTHVVQTVPALRVPFLSDVMEQLFPSSNQTMHCFLVQVEKFASVTIHFNDTEQIRRAVYDGPGLLSARLDSFSETYSASSFQCFVQIVSDPDEGLLSVLLHYSSMFIPHKSFTNMSVMRKHFILNEPGFYCIFSPCVMVFVGGPYLNITILEMLFRGPEDRRCKYGGLAASEEDWISEGLNPTICDNQSKGIQFGRSVFSQNMTKKLVLYWYKEYSTIHVVLTLSATQCEAVQVDHCMLNYLKLSASRTGRLAQLFGRKFSRPSSTTSSNSVTFSLGLQEDLLYTLKSNSCVTVMMVQSPFSWVSQSQLNMYVLYERICNFALKPSEIKAFGTIDYDIRGSFVRHRFNFHKSYTHDLVMMTRSSSQGLLHWETPSRNKTSKSHFKVSTVKESKAETKYFHLKTQAKTPTCLDNTIISFLLKYFYKGWIQVTIHRRVSDPRSSKRSELSAFLLTHVRENCLEKQNAVLLFKSNKPQISGSLRNLVYIDVTMNIQLTARYHLHYDQMENKYEQPTLSFSTEMDLRHHYTLAVPGTVDTVSIEPVQKSTCSATDSASIFLLFGVYHRLFAAFIYHAHQRNYKLNPLRFHYHKNKSNVYFLDRGQNVFHKRTIFRNGSVPTDNICKSLNTGWVITRRKSWEDASVQCETLPGKARLPTFLSRREMIETMSLFFLNEEAFYIESIYIGLKQNTSQVGVFLLWLLC